MFINEMLEKFKMEDVATPFVVSVVGKERVVISGIKSVIYTSPEEIKIRLKKGALAIRGNDLGIVEIGGGDVYVKGDICEVELG